MDREVVEVSAVFVGGGPANLAGAIHLARLIDAHAAKVAKGEAQWGPSGAIDKESVVVLEKGPEFGSHELSGAVMDPRGLRELFPDFEKDGCPIESPVTEDEVLYLGAGGLKLKFPVVPPPLRNHGNYIVSINKLVAWLARKAEETGILMAPGMPVSSLLVEDDKVVGVRGTDTGLDKEGQPKGQFQAGNDFRAPVTILGEGTRGHLAKWLINRFKLEAGKKPQVWSQGIKEIWKLAPGKHVLGKVVHTMGFPLRSEEYGGSWIYHIADGHVSLGFVSGLEYHDPLFDPHRTMQIFKTHPYVRDLLQGATLVRYGAKSIPVGGYHCMPQLTVDGAILVGDSAGLVNAMRLKGIHMAIKSGMLAAEAAFQALLKGDATRKTLGQYEVALRTSWAGEELYGVRDFHSGFERGFLPGLINAGLVTFSRGVGLMTGGLGTKPGHAHMKTLKEYYGGRVPQIDFKPDGVLTFRKIDEVLKSGTSHEENQPCHLVISDEDRRDICNTRCKEEFGNPCQHFCPAQVYEMVAREGSTTSLVVNASNCVHCKTCDIMDPYQVITWVAPEAGGGPIYSGM
jgi:electron-transferring-flavoprotein dehydrogenase